MRRRNCRCRCGRENVELALCGHSLQRNSARARPFEASAGLCFFNTKNRESIIITIDFPHPRIIMPRMESLRPILHSIYMVKSETLSRGLAVE